jgi:hypothetical protein
LENHLRAKVYSLFCGAVEQKYFHSPRGVDKGMRKIFFSSFEIGIRVIKANSTAALHYFSSLSMRLNQAEIDKKKELTGSFKSEVCHVTLRFSHHNSHENARLTMESHSRKSEISSWKLIQAFRLIFSFSS